MARTMNEAAPVTLRINPRQGDREEAMRRIARERTGAHLEPGRLAPAAIVTRSLGPVASLEAYREGRVSVQDEAAQLVGLLVGARPGELILDACAGVGGKTTHLAECMQDRGRIDALDRNGRKLKVLREACARLGLACVRPREHDLLASLPSETYDRALLDAPCSGLGVLRRHPEARFRLRPGDIDSMCDLQRRMLDAVAGRVRPGGVLVYSVCSFLGREGRQQVSAFLSRGGDYSLDEERTTLPHRDACDAFYMARLRRRT